ncbi:MAG: phytoene/squalene synthase family protein [Deferrisomatales bacterium]
MSRTFALTIPRLPPELLRVVANGYLLCRIADTVEDEPTLGAVEKGRFLRELASVVAGEEPAGPFARRLYPRLSEATLPAERELVERTPCVVGITRTFNERQQAAVARCVRIMCRGMEGFGRKRSLAGLETLEDLDGYCYHVAGVVGEMLTELFCDHSDRIASHREKLWRLAASFGQGLQMTNILKDVWDDRDRGACWLPRDVFARHGCTLGEIRGEPRCARFGQGLAELIGIAWLHLENALAYTLLVPPEERGIREFCLWALGMAALTLRKINRHRTFTDSGQVKISRRSVAWVVRVTGMLGRRDAALRALWWGLSRGLPQGTDPERGLPARLR